MRVETLDFVYTLYVDADGVWIMHAFAILDGAERWFDSVIDVSAKDPFKSRVKYDAWR